MKIVPLNAWEYYYWTVDILTEIFTNVTKKDLTY